VAIAIRGTTPGISSGVGDPTSLNLTGARQPQSGDVLLIIHTNDFYALSNMPTPTVAGSTSGVVAVTGGSADGGSDQGHAIAYTYVVGSTGDVTVAVDETGSADEEKALVVYVLSGVDTTTPIDVAGALNSAQLSTGELHAPSISPTSSDAFLVCHVSTGGGTSAGAAIDHPGSMTETLDVNVNGNFSIGNAVLQLVASGATGAKVFLQTVPNNAQGVSLSIAIKTAGGGAFKPRSMLLGVG